MTTVILVLIVWCTIGLHSTVTVGLVDGYHKRGQQTRVRWVMLSAVIATAVILVAFTLWGQS